MYQMVLGTILSIVSIVIAIIGILVGFIVARYYYNKSQKMTIISKSINWDDISIAINTIGKQLRSLDDERKFVPDLIFLPNVKSGIIAKYLTDYFDSYVPIFLGLSIEKKRYSLNSKEKVLIPESYKYFETSKWYVYIPMNIFEYNNKKILIIDDFAMSGEYLSTLANLLIDNGFDKHHIRTICLATTKVAVESNKAPDYYWKEVIPGDFYLPWGKPE